MCSTFCVFIESFKANMCSTFCVFIESFKATMCSTFCVLIESFKATMCSTFCVFIGKLQGYHVFNLLCVYRKASRLPCVQRFVCL